MNSDLSLVSIRTNKDLENTHMKINCPTVSAIEEFGGCVELGVSPGEKSTGLASLI